MRCSVQVTKLNALGYCPLLFVGRHGRKGVINGDMVHHIPVNDEVVREILKKMGKLYEHLLKSKIILVQNDYIILYYPSVLVNGCCFTTFIETLSVVVFPRLSHQQKHSHFKLSFYILLSKNSICTDHLSLGIH